MDIPLALLPMVSGLKVVVPNSLSLMTPYVLYEQQDWFEDEIKFIREILSPGDVAVDIGANYGLYTLSMAQKVGSSGRILAVEPAHSTAKCLNASLRENKFDWVTLDQVAVSDHQGAARLQLSNQAELNELVRGDSISLENTQEVPLVTLDQLRLQHGLEHVDFIKIDAEGEEQRIIAGGAQFFKDFSPLVQFEVKAGQDVHLELVDTFKALGYNAYRLVPGLSTLIPFVAEGEVDPYLLNLFCCKSDCANRLEAAGFLLQDLHSITDATGLKALAASSAVLIQHPSDRWPYVKGLRTRWTWDLLAMENFSCGEIVSLVLLSQNRGENVRVRMAALSGALKILLSRPMESLELPMLLTLARVSKDFGHRGRAVETLGLIIGRMGAEESFNSNIPFSAVDAHYERQEEIEDLDAWVLCQALESCEKLRSFSSYFTGEEGRELLSGIQQLGLGSEEMVRRLELLNFRYPSKSAT